MVGVQEGSRGETAAMVIQIVDFHKPVDFSGLDLDLCLQVTLSIKCHDVVGLRGSRRCGV